MLISVLRTLILVSLESIPPSCNIIAHTPERLKTSIFADHLLEGALVVLDHILCVLKSINDKSDKAPLLK